MLVSLESARKRHRQDGFTCREGPVTFLSLISKLSRFSADSTSPPFSPSLTLTRALAYSNNRVCIAGKDFVFRKLAVVDVAWRVRQIANGAEIYPNEVRVASRPSRSIIK